MSSVPNSPGFTSSVPSGDAMTLSQEAEEGYTRHPRPQPKRRLRISITMEGWLKKQASSGLIKPWQPRYFVLYENSREIRYYGGVNESILGNFPLDERGSIPLEFIVDIQVPEHDNHGGRRFEIHTSKVGSNAYPRDAQAAPAHSRVSHARIYSLEAPTLHERQEWVRHLRALTGIGGPASTGRAVSGLVTADGGVPRFAQPMLVSTDSLGRAPYSLSSSMSPSLEGPFSVKSSRLASSARFARDDGEEKAAER